MFADVFAMRAFVLGIVVGRRHVRPTRSLSALAGDRAPQARADMRNTTHAHTRKKIAYTYSRGVMHARAGAHTHTHILHTLFPADMSVTYVRLLDRRRRRRRQRCRPGRAHM